jgi:hypothetical protein
MKTDDLIRALAADLGHPSRRAARRPVWADLVAATVIMAIPSFAAIWFGLARSPHLAHGPGLTLAITLAAAGLLGAGALAAVAAASRPETALRAGWAVLPALLLAGGIVMELVRAGTGDWWFRLMGDRPLACFACVFLLSLPMLGGMLLALRRGAPARPRATGAMAGLAAGGFAAAMYMLHCPEASLLFIAAWHVPAILLTAGLGAWAGGRLLRW